MQTKKCLICTEDKPLSDFSNDKRWSHGKSQRCKPCNAMHLKLIHMRNAEKEKPEKHDKRCSCCKEVKKTTEFWKSKSTFDGYCNQCKACATALVKKREARNRDENSKRPIEELRERLGKTQACSCCGEAKNLEEFSRNSRRKSGINAICKMCAATNHQVFKRRNIAGHMLSRAKANAKALGYDFNLTIEDIIVPECCPITGFRLTYDGRRMTSPSLDRIDSSKGYIKGNVVVVSHRANAWKSDATIAQLRKMVEFYEDLIAKRDLKPL